MGVLLLDFSVSVGGEEILTSQITVRILIQLVLHLILYPFHTFSDLTDDSARKDAPVPA
jgi:hypothetical protein